VNQKFPNRDDDKTGQSDAIPDDTGFADFFLFHHAIVLLASLLFTRLLFTPLPTAAIFLADALQP
jgi:hypothetical protein